MNHGRWRDGRTALGLPGRVKYIWVQEFHHGYLPRYIGKYGLLNTCLHCSPTL